MAGLRGGEVRGAACTGRGDEPIKYARAGLCAYSHAHPRQLRCCTLGERREPTTTQCATTVLAFAPCVGMAQKKSATQIAVSTQPRVPFLSWIIQQANATDPPLVQSVSVVGSLCVCVCGRGILCAVKRVFGSQAGEGADHVDVEASPEGTKV